MQDKTEGELYLRLSDAPSLALLLPFLTSGPDLIRAWPDCWVSAKFLCAPISRKGVDSTSTTRWPESFNCYISNNETLLPFCAVECRRV